MSKTPGTPATTYNDCDCVPGHRCDCWDYRKQDERFDAAAEDVHRAFCDPEHEMVGEWDRNMADALRRRRLAIVREAEASAPITVEALRAALSGVLTALHYTYTAVPKEGEPHWCRDLELRGRHDATCGGMLMLQEAGRAALSASEAG